MIGCATKDWPSIVSLIGPEQPSVRPTMTAKQKALYLHHRDTANLMTSKSLPVFWVLDLEDETGFELAAAVQDPARTAEARDLTSAQGSIPALTAATSLESANKTLATLWSRPPLSEGRYMAVVSDGSMTVLALR